MILCVLWFHIYINLPFNNLVSFLTKQQNVDARAMQKVESRETRKLLVLFRDCSMSHKRTGIRISNHLFILHPAHLLTFHVIQFLHISTSLCSGNKKGDFFCTCLHNQKSCPSYAPCTYLQNTLLIFLHIHTTTEFSKQGTAHRSVTDKAAIVRNFSWICYPSSFAMGSSLCLTLMEQSPYTYLLLCGHTHYLSRVYN